jgi:hypothetical protein
MQISTIVSNAKSRFSMLLTEDTQIQAFLAQALTAYQDLAGCLRTVVIEIPLIGGYEPPPSFLAHAMCKDAYGDYVTVSVAEEDDGSSRLYFDKEAVYPLEYEFLVHLAYFADKPESHIPNRISGMVIDFLECLIATDNDDRVARVEASGKMDSSRTPTRLDRIAQKTALEEQFRANRAIISMASIHPR